MCRGLGGRGQLQVEPLVPGQPLLHVCALAAQLSRIIAQQGFWVLAGRSCHDGNGPVKLCDLTSFRTLRHQAWPRLDSATYQVAAYTGCGQGGLRRLSQDDMSIGAGVPESVDRGDRWAGTGREWRSGGDDFDVELGEWDGGVENVQPGLRWNRAVVQRQRRLHNSGHTRCGLETPDRRLHGTDKERVGSRFGATI